MDPTPHEPARDRHGFRIRGQEMTRIETFTDAAFAFAVTLLVVSIDAVPTSYPDLLAALQGVPAFAVSFLLLAVFWYGHWQWSRRYGLEDFPSIALSMLLVFVVLSYVYPLKYLMSLTSAWITSGAVVTAARIDSIGELYGIFAIYGFGFAAMAIVLALLNVHAWRRRDAIGLDAGERVATRAEIGAWLILGSVGLLSAFLALVTTPTAFVWPGWTYMLLPVVMPLYGKRSGKAIMRARGG